MEYEDFPIVTTNSATKSPLLSVAITVIGFFAIWIVYVLVLLRFPDTFNGDSAEKGILRAYIRVALWVGPLVLYAWYAEKRSFAQFLALRDNWRKGLVGGAILCGISAVLTVLRIIFQGAEFQALASIDLGTWLNPILTAPLVEELMFRGLIFRIVDKHSSFFVALVVSSALFALIHFPYWFLVGVHSGMGMAQELSVIFFIGVILGGSMKATGSLLTPLIGHWANNIASIVVT